MPTRFSLKRIRMGAPLRPRIRVCKPGGGAVLPDLPQFPKEARPRRQSRRGAMRLTRPWRRRAGRPLVPPPIGPLVPRYRSKVLQLHEDPSIPVLAGNLGFRIRLRYDESRAAVQGEGRDSKRRGFELHGPIPRILGRLQEAVEKKASEAGTAMGRFDIHSLDLRNVRSDATEAAGSNHSIPLNGDKYPPGRCLKLRDGGDVVLHGDLHREVNVVVRRESLTRRGKVSEPKLSNRGEVPSQRGLSDRVLRHARSPHASREVEEGGDVVRGSRHGHRGRLFGNGRSSRGESIRGHGAPPVAPINGRFERTRRSL